MLSFLIISEKISLIKLKPFLLYSRFSAPISIIFLSSGRSRFFLEIVLSNGFQKLKSIGSGILNNFLSFSKKLFLHY